MAQKQMTKKFALAGKVFRWLYVSVLALLLIGAVYFHAPWKVITLLVIFLLACTALPRPAGRTFWLSVAAVVIILIIWVFLPDDDENWRPYTFDEDLAALEAKYAIPDEQNAARLYNTLLENYDPKEMYPDFFDRELDRLTRREPWSSKDYPRVAEWLKGHEHTIATLMEASKIERCQFPVRSPFRWPLPEAVHHSVAMRAWVRLLVRAANNDLAENRLDKAIEKNLAVLRMGTHLRRQPTTFDIQFGFAVQALAINRIQRLIVTANATDDRLNPVENALAKIKHDWPSDWPRIFESKKLMTKNSWARWIYEVNTKGKVRFSRDPMAVDRARFPKEVPAQSYCQRKLTKAGTILAWLHMPPIPQKAAEVIDSVYEKYRKRGTLGFDWHRRSRPSYVPPRRINYFLYRLRNLAEITPEENFGQIYRSYIHSASERKAALLIIALRRYKNKTTRWPESLDNVKNLTAAENFIDPINDNSFVYKLTDDGFTLYSKGKNNLDEDGKNERRYGPDRPDDWIIWPR